LTCLVNTGSHFAVSASSLPFMAPLRARLVAK
jgi:hypothetical protein